MAKHKMQPLVTIGVLNKDGAQYLSRIIPPILNLKHKPKEIIVFDNGSRDSSLEYLKRFPYIKVINSKHNLGYGAGKNCLVSHAKGTYVLLLDNDIEVWNNNLLGELLDFYNQQKESGFLSVPLLDSGRQETEHYGLYYSTVKKPANIREIQKLSNFVAGGFIGGFNFFKKEVFDQLGGFDEIYPFNIDDYDLSARASLMGYKHHIYTETFAYHLGVDKKENLKGACWKNQYYLCGFQRMIWKNYTFFNAVKWSLFSAIWIFIKSVKLSFRFFSLKPLTSHFKSFFFFLRDLPGTLSLRGKIQRQRKIKKDAFLSIKPPRFNQD